MRSRPVGRVLRLALLTTACLAIGVPAFAQQKLQVLYVIPKGQQARPMAAQVLQSIMVDLQSHYLEQIGRTFELAEPLVTQVNAPGDAAAAVDWNANVQLVKTQAANGYVQQQNVVFTILEGTQGAGGGSWNIVKMTGGFWDEAYKTYTGQPHLLASKLHGWSHELGHAFGLMHTSNAKTCFASKGVDLGDLPSLIMEKGDDLFAVYNYGFLAEEKQLLMDPSYHQSCLSLLNEPSATARPHPTRHLRRYSVQPYKPVKGTNVTMVEFAAPGTQRGSFYKKPDGTWVESGYWGEQRYTFREAGRDEWSVYLRDTARNVSIQLDLFKMKVTYGPVGAARTMMYTILLAK